MRQSHALALAVLLTAFTLALALGFAQLSSMRLATIPASHDDIAAWKVSACACTAGSVHFC